MNDITPPKQPFDIAPITIEEEMRRSYLDYAMSVIVSRALPDVRDGLKPVHRRILYGMSELGIDWNKKYVKCARVTGDVMGKYHPHGNAAIYDALALMEQDWSLRLPLIRNAATTRGCTRCIAAVHRFEPGRRVNCRCRLLPDLKSRTGSLARPVIRSTRPQLRRYAACGASHTPRGPNPR